MFILIDYIIILGGGIIMTIVFLELSLKLLNYMRYNKYLPDNSKLIYYCHE